MRFCSISENLYQFSDMLRPAAFRHFQLEEKVRDVILAPLDQKRRTSTPYLLQAESSALGLSSLPCTDSLFYAFMFEIQIADTTYECVRYIVFTFHCIMWCDAALTQLQLFPCFKCNAVLVKSGWETKKILALARTSLRNSTQHIGGHSVHQWAYLW